jgi:DNA binding domain, excisionase family
MNRRKTDLLATLTTEQAAEQLQVSARTIRRMIERGSIDAQKLDPTAKSVYRIPSTEIERILGERAEPRNQPAGEQ